MYTSLGMLIGDSSQRVEIGFSQPPFVFSQFQIALILLFPIFVLSNGLIKEAGNNQKLYIRHAMIWPIIKLKFKEVD